MSDPKEYARNYYQKNKEKIKRRALNYQKQNRERTNVKNRKWRADNPERSAQIARGVYERRKDSLKEYRIDYKLQNWEKMRCKSAVANRVRAGILKKPDFCSRCGKTGCRIVAHHEDYSKPNDVVWVCCSCHKLLHLRLVEGKDHGGGF